MIQHDVNGRSRRPCEAQNINGGFFVSRKLSCFGLQLVMHFFATVPEGLFRIYILPKKV